VGAGGTGVPDRAPSIVATVVAAGGGAAVVVGVGGDVVAADPGATGASSRGPHAVNVKAENRAAAAAAAHQRENAGGERREGWVENIATPWHALPVERVDAPSVARTERTVCPPAAQHGVGERRKTLSELADPGRAINPSRTAAMLTPDSR
jgi:hypothetical protein